MELILTFKTPDVMDAVDEEKQQRLSVLEDFYKEQGGEVPEEEIEKLDQEMEDAREYLELYISNGEYVSIRFNSEKKTVEVRKRR